MMWEEPKNVPLPLHNLSLRAFPCFLTSLNPFWTCHILHPLPQHILQIIPTAHSEPVKLSLTGFWKQKFQVSSVQPVSSLPSSVLNSIAEVS